MSLLFHICYFNYAAFYFYLSFSETKGQSTQSKRNMYLDVLWTTSVQIVTQRLFINYKSLFLAYDCFQLDLITLINLFILIKILSYGSSPALITICPTSLCLIGKFLCLCFFPEFLSLHRSPT